MRQQTLSKFDDRRQIDRHPMEFARRAVRRSDRQKLVWRPSASATTVALGCLVRYLIAHWSTASERNAISWPLRPNFSKSKSMDSTSLIAIGSSMIGSGVASLVCPAVEGHECCFRDAGQQPGVHFVVGSMTHRHKPYRSPGTDHRGNRSIRISLGRWPNHGEQAYVAFHPLP